ncbi:MAG: queuosine precursor transporter [Phycisphaeraceae bacterium]|nr:queuosine precursor transporter [Phycisphaeraceae bacterium]
MTIQANDPTHPHALTRAQTLYLWLTAVNVTALVLANILGVKLFSFETGWTVLGWQGKIEHTVGMLPFPITFLITDLLTEYFGRKAARQTTYVAFAMAVFAFILISVGRKIPILEGIPGTANQQAFENIFGSATLMYIASLIAFLLGSLLDIFVFTIFKRMTGGKMVWLRATGSTIISQMFDSLLVTWLFFYGFPKLLNQDSATLDFVIRTAFTGYILKFVIAILLTPAIYLGRWAIARAFNLRPVPASEA